MSTSSIFGLNGRNQRTRSAVRFLRMRVNGVKFEFGPLLTSITHAIHDRPHREMNI